MQDADFSDAFCRFLQANVPSVEAAERLIAVLERGGSAWPPEDAGHVGTLARLYRERPVTLIRVIYALRDSKITTFADAFRLKR